ncbi:hypothetical protein FSP39_009460 [Pinctada imbricata]|uniref:SGNH hydrolase-type esterase domain-containing protein n=1 Tax=Pinctada imbricata TaxID=66713 RepID=A0AA88YBD0_PINIB|nr:hypothetical protein FSP39_009460 [Pinctada imbricata]
MVGSSIIKHAFVRARSAYGGANLSLDRFNASVWWQGQSGLVWKQLERKLLYLLKFEDAPQIILLHCGGNDIGKEKSIILRHRMVDTLLRLHKHFPNTMFVWSQILPRFKWRSFVPSKTLNKARVRLNRKMANLILSLGGAYIRYPELCEENMGFFADDKVHLSDLGNDMFLHHLQQGLQTFLMKNCNVYPSNVSGPRAAYTQDGGI